MTLQSGHTVGEIAVLDRAFDGLGEQASLIATRLSEAQRRAVMGAKPRGRNVRTNEPAFWRSYATAATVRKLAALGISYDGPDCERNIELTPLGLAVLAALRGSS